MGPCNPSAEHFRDRDGVTAATIATVAVSARPAASDIAKSRYGIGMLSMRGIEVSASVLIFASGPLLLARQMTSEQLDGHGLGWCERSIGMPTCFRRPTIAAERRADRPTS